MTTLVRGPIKLVTDRTDTVRKINLRAPELRLHGAGIVTDHNDDIPVVDGQVEFEALPGPAVLTLVTAGGAPLRSVDIVVPDEDTATLAECLAQIYTYSPPVVGRAQQFAREAGEHAARAEVLRDDTVAAAEHAETQAGVAAGHAAQTGEDRAQTGADRRQTGEDRAQTGKDAEAAEQWAAQSKDAATQAITAAEAVSQYVGDGFPEGKVTAPVGAIYIDRQATAGAVSWIKATGTGATGWALEYGDTGWRRLQPHGPLLTGDGDILFRRTNSGVFCRFDKVGVSENIGTYTYLTDSGAIPNGFRPEYAGRPLGVMSNLNANPSYLVGIAQGSRFRFQETIPSGPMPGTGNQAITGQFSWSTSQAWPTSLPGTPE